MIILVTGGCGFVGSKIALTLMGGKNKVFSLDNLSRPGSKFNEKILNQNKIKNYRIDIRKFKKLENLPKFDLVIDCCAEPSVEKSKTSPDITFETNLIGTFNVLKLCAKFKANIIFLSTSRVYSINKINLMTGALKIQKKIKTIFKINENFSTEPPISLYGFSKLSSEMLIREFAYLYNIKYVINRCGLISGPGQFGKIDQGIISYWVWQSINKNKLKYIGYGGGGHQIRDVLHIDDLCNLIKKQINKIKNQIFNVGGGSKNTISILNLNRLIENILKVKNKIRKIQITSKYDIPQYISDNKNISKVYNWSPQIKVEKIIKDIIFWQLKYKSKILKYLK